MHDAHMRHDTTSYTTLLALPPDLVERDRVRRQALRFGAIEHPGLASLRSAAFAGEGLALTWQLPADARVPAPTDDPVAVLAPIAAGLALAHDAGLAHGGIARDGVQVTMGRGILMGWRPGGSPAADVADLVALLDDWVPAGSVGADVVQILIAGADPDPLVRPSMARIAAALEASAMHGRPPISPPAQRRARLDDAPPPRVVEPVAAAVPAGRDSEPIPSASQARGRHAARRAPAGSIATALRIRWRWGLALAGGAAVVFLGLSAVGSAGSAQVMCPAPVSSPVAQTAG